MRRKPTSPRALCRFRCDSGADGTVRNEEERFSTSAFEPRRISAGLFSWAAEKGIVKVSKKEIAVKKAEKSAFGAREITQIGILSGIAFVLMSVEFPLWFAPGFYKLDLSELPVLIGGFAMGPLAGVMIEMIKVLLYFFIHGSTTAGVGDLANFVIGCCFIVPATVIYRMHKTKRRAILGLAVGTVAMTAVGSLMNAFLLLPLYASVFHMPLEALMAMGTQVNPSITDLRSFVFFAVVPFNLFKGTLVSCLTILIYKKVSPILHATFRKA